VVFADRMQKTLLIVVITIGDDGRTTAYIHRIGVSDICKASGDIYSAKLVSVEFQPAQGGQIAMLLRFEPGLQSVCAAKALTLRLDEFIPAATEVHLKGRGKPSVMDR
jgi:hypothetical protein